MCGWISGNHPPGKLLRFRVWPLLWKILQGLMYSASETVSWRSNLHANEGFSNWLLLDELIIICLYLPAEVPSSSVISYHLHPQWAPLRSASHQEGLQGLSLCFRSIDSNSCLADSSTCDEEYAAGTCRGLQGHQRNARCDKLPLERRVYSHKARHLWLFPIASSPHSRSYYMYQLDILNNMTIGMTACTLHRIWVLLLLLMYLYIYLLHRWQRDRSGVGA